MLQVRDIMTPEPFTLRDIDTLQSARSIMYLGRIRHIPIVNKHGLFVGLLTHRDLLSATVSILSGINKEVQDDLDANVPIREIMHTDVHCVTPDTDLRETAKILLNHKYGCLPVVEENILRGIVTEADFLKLTITFMDDLEEYGQK